MIPPRITPETSIVAVIDVQDKLIATLHDDGTRLLTATRFLLDVARILNVPIVVTEQYPKGLGHTVAGLGDADETIDKTGFSGCIADAFLERLNQNNVETVILLGMEAHVCVLQTALDLLRHGVRVMLAVDATDSALSLDREIALRRMEQAGVTLATTESIAFEWLGDAKHPQFKTVSKRLIEFRQSKAQESRV